MRSIGRKYRLGFGYVILPTQNQALEISHIGAAVSRCAFCDFGFDILGDKVKDCV